MTSVEPSITITAAVPRLDPTSRSASKSMTASRIFSPRTHGTDDPPGITALRFDQPPRIPPQWRSISSSKPIDMDSSTTQGLFTCPLTANTLVPVLLGRPKPANHSAPRRRIVGATAMDSTLLTVVGQP